MTVTRHKKAETRAFSAATKTHRKPINTRDTIVGECQCRRAIGPLSVSRPLSFAIQSANAISRTRKRPAIR